MYKEIFFDHTFNEDPGHKLHKKLGRLGFTLSEHEVEHPGKAMCRFIMVGNKYLEFVHIGKGGIAFNKPGISFGATSLMDYAKRISKKADFKVHSNHKNYDWLKNNTDYLPGWNFVNFTGTGVRAFYPWFTEYEPDPKRKKKRKKSQTHVNGVNRIIGAEFQISKTGERFFEILFGAKIKSEMTLPDGFKIYFHKNAKCNRHLANILATKSLRKTKSYMPKEMVTTFMGQEAIRITDPKGNSRMWDLIIIEE